ncbi:MAG: site-2 protease family protein [Candidatus Riflebacteria bacterium]|nr:site-2 protease family protein [Candidatus Riflebacteria bacterium]
MSWSTMLAGFAGAIAGLGPLVFFHELGHFAGLKIYKLPVHIFSLGFGSALIKKKIGQTEYRISAIPLGGYVMPEDPLKVEARHKSGGSLFPSFTPWQNLVMALGGPCANLLLAAVLFFIVNCFWGESHPIPVIDQVMQNTPAQQAGLTNGDQIIRMNDVEITNWQQFSTAAAINGNNQASIAVVRKGVTILFNITPVFDGSRHIIGIKPKFESNNPLSVIDSLYLSVIRTVRESVNVLLALKSVVFSVNAGCLTGPVSIISQTFSIASDGLASFLTFIAILSVNFAVFNLLPIPPLDGTRICMALYEIIFRNPMKESIIIPVYKYGVIGLLIVFAIITLRDLSNIIQLSEIFH